MGNKRKSKNAAKKWRKAQRKKHQLKEKSTKNKSGPFFQVMENPFANLSPEERIKLAKEIGENSNKLFHESLIKIQDILKQYDATMLISILSAYGLTAGVSDAGIRPSTQPISINQSDVEICQALALQVDPKEASNELVTPEIVQQAIDALVDLSQSNYLRRMTDEFPKASEEQAAIIQLQEWVRANTQTVRNWGYYSQVKNISKELYCFFNELLLEKVGFRASEVIEVFNHLLSSIEISLSERMKLLSELYSLNNPKDMIYRYHEIIGQSTEEAQAFIDKFKIDSLQARSVFFMICAHYDLRLYDNYIFHPENIAKTLEIKDETALSILECFSYRLGDLTKYDTEHIFLNNPIWNKQVIKIDDNEFFCPIPQLFFSFILESFDKIIEKFDKDALHDRRANYLEDKIEEIIKRRFPEASTVKNIKWKHEGSEYETDLITFIDSYAIIVEAKSGKITASALRGAPERIKRHIEEILLVPNEQSKRLRNKLYKLIEGQKLDDELRKKLPVSLDTIHQVLRISVSLEDFASLQANVNRLKKTGWIPDDFEPCPTMNIADFETLFDVLEHPVQIIHYLERRVEMEGILDYIGDELDLIGWYIGTLFNIGNLHEEKAELIITEMSAPLDKYYQSKDAGVILPKPTPKISPLFQGILKQLEQRQTHRWTEIGAILHRFSPDDQMKLIKLIKKLEKIVQKNWMIDDHKNIAVYNPPRSSEYALCYLLFKNDNANKRDEFIDSAMQQGLEPEHVKKCLVIARNIDRNDLSYHFIGLFQ